MIFRAGIPKAIFIERERLKAGKPAIAVKAGERPPHRFTRVLLYGPSMVEQLADGTAWLYTMEEVEGQREEEKQPPRDLPRFQK